MYRFLPYAPSGRAGGQFLRPVEAIGLTAEGSIQQLTAFDYAGSELRQAVVVADEYAIPARRRGDLGQVPRSKKDRLQAVFQEKNRQSSVTAVCRL
jgi:hypothetical protein